MQRRNFIKNTALFAAATTIGVPSIAKPKALKPKIKKSLKIEMVKEGDTIMDKFKLLKELGYDGVELSSPHKFNHREILDAKQKTGLEIPGVVNSQHWKLPLSHPDPSIRKQCSDSVIESLND